VALKLNGISVPAVWLASGVLNFFGEGYWYDDLFRYTMPGFGFKNALFTSKTTTIDPRKGNMPLLKDGITPRDLKPACIYVQPFKNFALNAVGLSGPGAEFLFKTYRWQQMKHGVIKISFMPVGKTSAERIIEVRRFAQLLKFFLPDFVSKVIIELNISCPNVGRMVCVLDTVEETNDMLAILGELGVPIVVKTDPLFSVEGLARIAKSTYCSALSPSNTIHFDKLPREDRNRAFPNGRSPLRQFGGGGFSGPIIKKYGVRCVQNCRLAGIQIPIIGGGGIDTASDVVEYHNAGASGVAIGSVVFLRPFRVQGIIDYGNMLFS
jgi:dihydroorotate dehydrogenase